MKYIAEIPVRLGSKRVPKKNLRLICGKPMVSYAVEAAKASKYIDKIFINSEDEILRKIANELSVNFYKRKAELSIDTVTSDEFNYDFLLNNDCDALVMVNPVSPLITSDDIDLAIETFEKGNFDTLISVKEERLQSFYLGKPININIHEKLAMTQNINPIQIISWAVSIWKKKSFMESYEKNGYAVFNGKLCLFPINPLHALKISYEEDFFLAEIMISAKKYHNEDTKYYE